MPLSSSYNSVNLSRHRSFRGLSYVPKIKDPLDTSNFDPYPEDEAIQPYKGDQAIFSEF